MRKSFTLLEFMVVIIIISVLATLGVGQYFRAVEQSRSSEAKAVIGVIRGLALAHYNEFDSLTPGGADDFSAAAANIGSAAGEIPGAPRSSHFFTYGLEGIAATSVTIVATRCSGGSCKGGATPWVNQTIKLTVTCPGGQDTWVFSANAPWR